MSSHHNVFLGTFLGRLRRWNSEDEWGVVFSEWHNGDIFIDGLSNNNKEACKTLREGDDVFFEVAYEDHGLYAVCNIRRAESIEVTTGGLTAGTSGCSSCGEGDGYTTSMDSARRTLRTAHRP